MLDGEVKAPLPQQYEALVPMGRHDHTIECAPLAGARNGRSASERGSERLVSGAARARDELRVGARSSTKGFSKWNACRERDRGRRRGTKNQGVEREHAARSFCRSRIIQPHERGGGPANDVDLRPPSELAIAFLTPAPPPKRPALVPSKRQRDESATKSETEGASLSPHPNEQGAPRDGSRRARDLPRLTDDQPRDQGLPRGVAAADRAAHHVMRRRFVLHDEA